MGYGEEQRQVKLSTPLGEDAQRVIIDAALGAMETLELDHALKTELGGLIGTLLKKLMSGALLLGG